MPVFVELSSSESCIEQTGVPLLPDFQTWANQSCLVDEDVVTSFQILSKDEMKKLNLEYSGNDKPTNVLSFPMSLPEHVEINLLGDVVLCAEVISEEAVHQNKSLEAHWAHMVVHGMLHLQGYDHINDADAEAMEALEITILQKLGFTNPYVIKPYTTNS